jgi:hypothetical protein
MQKINPKKLKKKNKKHYIVSASIIIFLFSTLSLFVFDTNKGRLNISQNRAESETQEKKLEKLVLEHLGKVNSVTVSGVSLSNVVYEK